VGQVHEKKQADLDRLVGEIFPSLEDLIVAVGEYEHEKNGQDTRMITNETLLNREHIDDYIRAYSASIPTAVPSKDLALSEFRERNAVWLKSIESSRWSQAFHLGLLRQHMSEEDIKETLQRASKTSEEDNGDGVSGSDRTSLELNDIGLVVWGSRKETTHARTCNVVIVGGGMIGSSVALFLARCRPDWKITLLDDMPEQDFGRTTKASWAWLNANNKEPKSYQALNQLGVHSWKHMPQLQNLVSWQGSLVRYDNFPNFVDDGGYPVEGPLSDSRILELEPMARWGIEGSDDAKESNPSFTFFFPDEGCVDPSAAIQILRQEARELGVDIKCNYTVTNVIRDDEHKVCAVESSCDDVETPAGNRVATIPADVVVVAAGCGAKAQFLGGLPLLDRPGRIEYGVPVDMLNFVQPRLRRILVDPGRHSHVMQRSNGDIVAGGGGLLEFGGSGSASLSRTVVEKKATVETKQDSGPSISLLGLARELAPSVVQDAKLVRSCQAVRPMPLDGLPVVGYAAQGLYTVVTHSGITLGPLLAAVAAGEIVEGISCDILEPYRPTRFF
jgi:glycine/D-amino acid oxidase-like deaminating enzyme